MDKRDPFETLREDPFLEDLLVDEDEVVYSPTAACGRCGEVHPV